MFIDSTSAGLFIIGASEYDNDPEQNRAAFAKGADGIVRYFKSSRVGLGIPNRNILNLFNSPLSPSEQKVQVYDYLAPGRLYAGCRPSRGPPRRPNKRRQNSLEPLPRHPTGVETVHFGGSAATYRAPRHSCAGIWPAWRRRSIRRSVSSSWHR